MKTLKLTLGMLLSFVICIGCSNKNEGEELTTSSKIEVKAQIIPKQSVSGTLKSASNSIEAKSVVFTGDEIVSYNAKTGEMILKTTFDNEKPLDILKNFSDKLEFYKDGRLLFTLKSKIVTDIESALYNEPVLHYSSLEKNKCFIRDGYPWGLPIDDTTTERTGQAATVAKERRANAEKILAGWNIFIEELKKQGKYIEK